MSFPLLNTPFKDNLTFDSLKRYSKIRKEDLEFKPRENVAHMHLTENSKAASFTASHKTTFELATMITNIASLFGEPSFSSNEKEVCLSSAMFQQDSDIGTYYDACFFIKEGPIEDFSYADMSEPLIVRVHPLSNYTVEFSSERRNGKDKQSYDAILYDTKIEIITEPMNGMPSPFMWMSIGDYFGSDSQHALINKIGRLIEHAYKIRHAQACNIDLRDDTVRSLNAKLTEIITHAHQDVRNINVYEQVDLTK